VMCLAVSSSGKLLFSGSYDYLVKVAPAPAIWGYNPV